jgi:O-antigen/teichoic acid export membrane protein
MIYGLSCIGLRSLYDARFEPRLYPQAVRFGAPLVATTLAYMILGWSDRYFIAAFHSADALGVYAYHYNIIAMVAAVSAPLIGSALDPHVVAAHNTGDVARSRLLLTASLRYRLLVVVPIVIVTSFWGSAMVVILATEVYARAGTLMAWLAPIPVLGVLVATSERSLFLQRRTLTIGACYVGAALANLGLNWLLIPRHRYYGAAVATDLSLVLLVAFLMAAGARPAMWKELRAGRIVASAAAAAVIAWSIQYVIAGATPKVGLVLGATAVLVTFGVAAIAFGVVSRQERQLAGSFAVRLCHRSRGG